jgi:hypothetical protein
MAQAKWANVGRNNSDVKIGNDVVSGRVTLSVEWNDNPNTNGYALNSVSAEGKSVSLSGESVAVVLHIELVITL